MADGYSDDPVLREVVAYWERKRGARPMPGRRDLDPIEMRGVLPHVRLTEVVEGGKRFRYRVVGTAIVRGFGGEITGRYTDEMLSGARLAYIEQLYRTVCDTRRPIFARTAYVVPDAAPAIARRIMAPLSDDGVEVSMVLTAFRFPPGREGEAAIGYGSEVDLASCSLELL